MDKSSKSTRCSTGACVDIKADGDQLVFTSTISPDRGATRYDLPEIATFFRDVKAGKWDHLLGGEPRVHPSETIA